MVRSGTPASSTTKTGRHDIAEILLKVALKHKKSIKSINIIIWFMISQNSEDQSGPSISDNLREYTHTSGIAALKQCKQVLTNTFLQNNFFLGYFVQIQTELPHLVVF